MRIISGCKKGMTIQSPKDNNTRPTLDRVRESIFNVLGNIEGLSLLDVFGGSGAISMEGASRGVDKCVVIEKNRSAQNVIKSNIDALNFQSVISLKCGDYKDYLPHEKEPFHIIFLDPPYNKGHINPVCLMILENNLLYPNGIIIVETASKDPEKLDCGGLYLWKERKFGDTLLNYYKLT